MSLKKEKSDEILNSLLHGSNFDYIKDESLDIDLSKCAPILPTINNSLSNFPWQLDETEFLLNTNLPCDDSTNANDMEPLFKRIDYLTDNSITFQLKDINISPLSQLHIKNNSPIKNLLKYPPEIQPTILQQNNHYSKSELLTTATNQFELKNFIKISNNSPVNKTNVDVEHKNINLLKKAKQTQKQNLRKQSVPKKGNNKVAKHSKAINSLNLNDNNNINLEVRHNYSDERNFPLPKLTSVIPHKLQNTSSQIPLKLKKSLIQSSQTIITSNSLESSIIPQITSINEIVPLLNDSSLKTPTNFSQNTLNPICSPIQQMPIHPLHQIQETAVISSNNLVQIEIAGNLLENIPQQNNVPLKNDNIVIKSRQKKTDERKPKSTAVKQTILTKYKCDSCDLIFDNISDLNATNSHLPEHIVILICSECDKEFPNEIILKKHFKTHLNSVCRSAMMECPDCGKSLKLGSMWMHRKIHTNGKKSTTQNGKNNNVEKTFECPDCGKCFPERSHMIRHQKYHTHERPFKCEKCGKMYKTERCLKVHSLVHLDQRPFSCAVCQKSFLSNSKLKQHSNIHTGERPYKCNYCSRDFTNFPNWLKHTRRRHNVDHKTGEVLEKMPKYCSKTKKKPTSKKSEDANKDKEIQNEVKSNIKYQDDFSSVKLKEDKKIDIKEEIMNHDDFLKGPNLKLIKLDPENYSNNRNFSDFHSLSITSTEDLLMEQALEMEEQAAILYNSNQNQSVLDHIDPESKLFNALNSIESSPLSSPASDFQTYMPLPPIETVSNNFYLNSLNKNMNLPSINTCFLASNNFQ